MTARRGGGGASGGATGAADDGDAKERFDLASLSYREVLDATKHQDDKVGRFLTAVSFLIGAAVAFGTRADVLSVRYDVDGLLPLPGVLFAGFFAVVVVALIFLLMALGQPLGPPRPRSTATRPSRLFFLSISDLTETDWSGLWDPAVGAAEMRAQVTDNLISETYTLATRASKKYRRTSEAQALFTVALVFFGLALALAINVLVRHDAAAGAAWNLRSRLVATFILTSFSMSLGYSWVRWKQVRGEPWVARQYGAWWLGMVYPAAVLLPPHVVSVGWGALFATLVAVGMAACWWHPTTSGSTRWAMLVLVLGLAFITPVAVANEAERWRLALGCASVVLFEAPRLLDVTFRGPGSVSPRRP